MNDSNLYIGRVVWFDTDTKDAGVVIPQLQGTAPVICRAYLNSESELTFIPEVQSGNRVLVMFDGGDTASQPYWMVATAGLITAEKIASGSITTPKLAAGAITSEKIVAGAITTEKLATSAIQSANYDYTSGDFSTAGSFFDLAAGDLRTPGLFVDGTTGDTVIRGEVTASRFTLVNGADNVLSMYSDDTSYERLRLFANNINFPGEYWDIGWSTSDDSFDTQRFFIKPNLTSNPLPGDIADGSMGIDMYYDALDAVVSMQAGDSKYGSGAGYVVLNSNGVDVGAFVDFTNASWIEMKPYTGMDVTVGENSTIRFRTSEYSVSVPDLPVYTTQMSVGTYGVEVAPKLRFPATVARKIDLFGDLGAHYIGVEASITNIRSSAYVRAGSAARVVDIGDWYLSGSYTAIQDGNLYILFGNGAGDPTSYVRTSGSRGLALGTNDANRLVIRGSDGLVSINNSIQDVAPPSSPSTSGFLYVIRSSTTGIYHIFTSKREVKENITPVTGSGDIIDQLRPVTFTEKPKPDDDADVRAWKAADIQYGFIAEEVFDVADGHLATHEIVDGEIVPNGWSVHNMVSVLVAEVQNLRGRIAALEAPGR